MEFTARRIGRLVGLLSNYLRNGSEPNTNDLFVHSVFHTEVCLLFKDIKKLCTVHWNIYNSWLSTLIAAKATELCAPASQTT